MDTKEMMILLRTKNRTSEQSKKLKELELKSRNYTFLFHFRRIDDSGNIISKGGTTIAVLEKNDLFYYGIAICSNNEMFWKMEGRIRANLRANCKRAYLTQKLELEELANFTKEINTLSLHNVDTSTFWQLFNNKMKEEKS
jgi:hypothetical protein